ncbi:hypothetical protein D3C86_1773730 [compost metagenome]
MIPSIKITGRKTAITAKVAATAAGKTSFDPSEAAFVDDFPILACRTIFSSSMIASSTTIEMAKVNAKSVKRFNVNPAK